MNLDMYRQFFLVQEKHWWFRAKKLIVLDQISKFLPAKSGAKLLDVGCGSGLMLNSLAELGSTSGMDMSDEAVKFSQEIFSGTVKKGSLPDAVPYEIETFDLITALDVIEHIDDDVGALRSMRSLLVSGGHAIITVPAYMFLWSKFDEINHHKRRYVIAELRDKLKSAGFVVERITYFNSLLFPVAAVVRVLNRVLGRDGSDDVQLPGKWLNSILFKLFVTERTMLRWFSFPFGVSLLAVVRKD